MRSAEEWWKQAGNVGAVKLYESEAKAFVRAIQLEALETAASICDRIDQHGPTDDECAAEAAIEIRKLKEQVQR